jgi:ABC-2 type transport system ATP-binding protein
MERPEHSAVGATVAPVSEGSAIETVGLRRTFGSFTAVDALDLEVPKGSLFALLGPNGAGKSTTIKILTTLLAPTAGSAKVAGFDVMKDARDVRRSSGVVFQESSLDDRLTAKENLIFHASVFGVPPGDRAARADEGLAWIGLSPVKDQPVRTFSGGMRRRLEIARALTHRPEVLILDEPTVGLDPQTRRVVWDHLLSIASSRERTVFVTTHYMDEAERCGDVAIIDHGKLITRGSPRQIVERAGAEKLVVQSEDDARLVEKATGLGLSAKPGSAGVEVSGERAEVMLAKLASLGLGLREVSIVRPRLEDAFVALTGRDIRDEPDAGAGNHAAMRTQLRARGRKV